MTADLLVVLAKANLACAAAVLIVLALRAPARRLFGARVAYSLWLLTPLAVAGGLAPPRTVHLIQRIPVLPSAVLPSAPTSAPADYSPLLLGLWLAGAALSLAVLAERQRRFRVSLGPLKPSDDGALRTGRGGGPAVFGAFKPRIILPSDFEDRFSAGERQAILAHERRHLAAGHAQTNGLVALVQCLFWFNPAVWLAGRALRLDQELACDAAVLTRSAEFSPRLYGEALLRAQLNAPPLPLGCYWPSTGPKSLKERLLMLKTPNPSLPIRLAGAALIALAAGGCAVAAWAAQPAQVKVTPQPINASAQTSAVAAAPDQPEAEPPSHTAISNAIAGHQVVIAPPKPAPADEDNTPAGWAEKPDAAALAPYYPAGALQQETQGLAVIRCQVGETGKPYNCSLLSESPEGANFGDSALQMAETFTLKPPSAGGSQTVTIPIKFQLQ